MKNATLSLIMMISVSFCCIGQNVGIGTAAPSRAKLVVEGVAGTGATNAVFGNNQAGISLQENWPTIGFNQYRDLTSPGSYGRFMKTGYAALVTISQDNGIIYLESFGYNIGNAFTGSGNIGWAVKPTGNMSVGHGNPGAMLDVVRGSNVWAPDGTAAFRGSLYNSHFSYASPEHTYIRGGKVNSNVFINDIPSGNVFIGGGATAVGINTLSIAGAGTLVIDQKGEEGIGLTDNEWGNHRWEINNEHYNNDAAAPTSCLALRYTGRATTLMGWFRPTDGGYSDNSDRRLKENIESMPPVLGKLMRLNPSSYNFIAPKAGGARQLGLIAQEVKGIFPELVDVRQLDANDESPVKDLHGMNYNGLTVIAVKAIQEQQAEIDALENQVARLEAILSAKK